ncbi:MAG TPA: amidohydrolase family protein [Candidatus Acidoferrales bacterium]|nr:amidohydrolase family protein [Candidatus Acidoferrales bacterium]
MNPHLRLRRVLIFIVPSAMVLAYSPIVQARQSASKAAQAEASSAAAKGKAEQGLTLKTERELKFSTDEGTWISLDVSPDGEQIVFDLLGHVYVMPVAGGEAKAITSGQGFDSMPHFSPDGNRIVFVSDRSGADNVWIANADGTHLERLTNDQQSSFAEPIWSRDGQSVIVARHAEPLQTTWALWMYYVNGGTGVEISKPAPPKTSADKLINYIEPQLSPDGKYIYYTRRPGAFKVYDDTYPLSQIARQNLKTGDEDILSNANGSGIRPVLSPDGEQLVYGTYHEGETALRIMNLATGEDRWLKFPVQHDMQETLISEGTLPAYAFTPDGKDLILFYGGKIHRLNVADRSEAIIPFSARIDRQLGPRLYFPTRVNEGPVKARLIQDPHLSPNGKRVAFSVLTHLYVMNLPDGKPQRLSSITDRAFQPVWSPDGNWIAYVTWSDEGGEIWKVRADGQSAPQQISHAAAYYYDPVWSPDGTKIVAIRAATDARLTEVTDFEGGTFGSDIVWVSSDGGDVNIIRPTEGSIRPHFGPEPDRVYAYSRSEGLYSMRFDGTDRRTILKVLGHGFSVATGQPTSPASDVRMSPDGQWAIAEVNYQLYVMAVPHFGESATVNVFSPSVPVKKITDIGSDYFGWADGGKSVTWAVGATFFRRPLDSVKFERKQPPAEAQEGADKSGADTAEKSEKKPAEMLEAEAGVQHFDVDLEFPRYTPHGTVVLRGAKVITMKGDEIIQNADIVVKDNRIASVGRRGSVAIPADATIIDVKGATITPGFIDLHPHWLEIRRGVLDTQNWDFTANLAYGVTAGRDPQTMTNDMFAYQDMVDTGQIIGPRAYSTGPGVFSDTDFQSYDEALDYLTKYKKYYRTNYLKSYMVGNRKQRQWVIEACKQLEIMPTTEGGIDTRLDLTHFIDGFNNEHSMPTVPLYNDVIQLLVKSQGFETPTLIVAYGGSFAENYFYENTDVHDNPKLNRFVPHNILDERTKRRPWVSLDQQIFPKLAATDNKIVEAGGNITVGSHGQLQGIGYDWELWALSSGGMSNMNVLRAATIQGARALGLEQDLGSIEPGKLADMVILAKDPLADIHNTNMVKYVMKNGELFDGATLDEVWPEQKPLAPLWWWSDKP